MQGAWFFNQGQGPQGPINEPQLVSMIEGGAVAPTAMVAPSGTQSWMRLDAHPPFQAALQRRQQGYGAPPAPQGYGAPPAPQGYGAPPAPQGYGPPHAPQGYGPPPGQQAYGAPPPYGRPGYPQRPAPAKKNKYLTPALVLGGCLVLGGVMMFAGRRSGGSSSYEQIDATVEKAKLSKDGNSFTVTVAVSSLRALDPVANTEAGTRTRSSRSLRT